MISMLCAEAEVAHAAGVADAVEESGRSGRGHGVGAWGKGP